MPDALQDLRARLPGLMPADRHHLQRRLGGAARIDSPARRRTVLDELSAEIGAAEARLARRRAASPTQIAYPAELPITDKRRELLDTIRDHQVVIVAGETGSGKSTQIPKLCLELGRGVEGYIGHTQPRRIAARSIADRVAEELGTVVGGMVGYAVRFSDKVGEDTLVKVMTDGLLLAEVHRDRRLRRYDTIIIDEAHERSLNIDFLLGFLKSLLPKRPDLKLIITSATIDTTRFSAHFGDAPVVEVSGRNYPVEVRYRPLDDPALSEPRDQTQGICDAVEELFGEGPGDILVFCSGEREIRDAARALGEMRLAHTEILPLYARLSASEQQRVFRPHTGRRIVLATNVAETSLTVPGIRYVVDPGTARISRYSRRTKVQRLPIEPVSRASADQRAGRCGRLGPGICVRLFDEADFVARPLFTEPEIQRTNLASVILQMSSLGLGDVESFPFLDPPDRRSIRDGVALLEELGAVDQAQEGTDRWLTRRGRQLAKLPVDLRLARMIIESDARGCLREVLIIASGLAIQDPRERPAEKEQQADQLHARFKDPGSDLLSWLHLWDYVNTERRSRTAGQFRRMCRDEFLHYRRIREWQDVHAQLREVAGELKLRRNPDPAQPEAIHQALLSGLLSHLGHKDPDGYEYRGARGSRFAINPGSSLFKQAPEWVMAAELVETTRLWARGVAALDPEWVEEVGSHLVNRTHSDPWWEADRGAAVAHETVTIYGLPLQTTRTVLYGGVDPAGARELLILNALVAGDWEAEHAFVAHNREKVQEVLGMEARARRTDLLVDDRTVYEFFDARIPSDITSTRHFDSWWKKKRPANPHLLDLSVTDLIDPEADAVDDRAYPEEWQHGDLTIPLGYEFDVDSPTDGVSVVIPLVDLERINPAVFEWHIPGLREELVVALIRSLPKRLRRQLTPIPETARSLLSRGIPPEVGLTSFLRRELARSIGEPLPTDAFDLALMPSHLRPMFKVVTDDGSVIAEGRDLAVLKAGLRDEARSAASSARHDLEVDGLTTWSIGELPHHVEVEGPDHTITAYPALIDEVESVSVRLLATEAEQLEAMWEGTRRLVLLSLPAPGGLLRPILTAEAKLALAASPYDDADAWATDCLSCALDEVMVRFGGLPWNAVQFDALFAGVRDELHDELMSVAEASLRTLWTLRNVRAGIDSTAGKYPEAASDIRIQIRRLIYDGFLTGLGADRLTDVQRYLEAIDRRLTRLPEDPSRDQQLMHRVRALETEFDHLQEVLPSSGSMTDIAWMLQELRVSLFAQTLGTREKVSEKRIRSALTGVAMNG
jgi:ATP-dependent helicase HrpA